MLFRSVGVFETGKYTNLKYKDVLDFGINDKGHALSETQGFRGANSPPNEEIPMYFRGLHNGNLEQSTIFAVNANNMTENETKTWRAAIWVTGDSTAAGPPSESVNNSPLTTLTEAGGLLPPNPYRGLFPHVDYVNNQTTIANSIIRWSRVGNVNTKQAIEQKIKADPLANFNACIATGANVVPRVVLETNDQGADSLLEINNGVKITKGDFRLENGFYVCDNKISLSRVEVSASFYNAMVTNQDYSVVRQSCIPKWLHQQLVTDSTNLSEYPVVYHAGDAGFVNNAENKVMLMLSPNYNNPNLIEAHSDFVEILGELYNSDPIVAFVQLGSIGVDGEWSNQKVPLDPGTAEKYIAPYLQFLGKKQLMMRTPNGLAIKYDTGIYNDMFGCDANQPWNQLYYLYNDLDNAMPDFWKTRVICGEFGSGGTDWCDTPYFEATYNDLRRSHASFVAFDDGRSPNNANEILKHIGYRLYVNEVRANTNMSKNVPQNITVTWRNSGFAPFYFDWDVEFYLISGADVVTPVKKTNPAISRCLPHMNYYQDIEFDIPNELATGAGYKLAVAIINPVTSQPGINLANVTTRVDKRFVILANITIN